MRNRISYLIAALLVAANAYAGAPSFNFNRFVDYGPHPTVGNCRAAVTRANGGILFVDGYDDWVQQVANPLTTDGTNDNAANTLGVFQALTGTTYWFGAGSSYQGITYDGTNYFTSGVQRDTDSCVLVKLTDPNTGSAYTATQLTVSPDGKYSGCTAVAPNTLAMANYVTGALQFFTVSGTTATATGAAIANPGATGFWTTQVFYYESGATKKIFAFLAKDNATRRIDVFNTDGTPGGTTYAGNFCPDIVSNYVLEGTNVLKYCSLTADPVKKVLVAAAAVDTAGPNGYDMFNIDTIVTNGSATPYLQLRSADFTNNSGTNHLTAGAAFFTSAATDYIAFMNANRLSVYQVIPSSGVAEWHLYK